MLIYLIILLCSLYNLCNAQANCQLPVLEIPRDIEKIFPKTITGIEKLKKRTLANASSCLSKILEIAPDKRNGENSIIALNNLVAYIQAYSQICLVLSLTNSSSRILSAARVAHNKLQEFLITQVWGNSLLYRTILTVKAKYKKNLSEEKNYTLEKYLRAFKRFGAHLAKIEQDKIKQLSLELQKQKTIFNKNISQDELVVEFLQSEIDALPKKILSKAKFNKRGMLTLSPNDQNYYYLMAHTKSENIRKKIWHAYINRAYPANSSVLENIRKLSSNIAHVLGYPDFAHFDLTDQMAQNPETVSLFLQQLAQVAHTQSQKTLTEITGKREKLAPWNVRFLVNQAKEKLCKLDDTKIAAYFELDHVVTSLLKICSRFFSLRFEPISVDLWNSQVKVYACYTHKQCLGYIIFDLLHRREKYKHERTVTVIPAFDSGTKYHPALMVMLADIDIQAPLTHGTVVSLFHEMGHALHILCGATELPLDAGTQVSRDFAEMPAQVFEQLAWEPAILKQITKHKKTKKAMPATIIKQLHTCRNFAASFLLEKNIFKSLVALELYQAKTDSYGLTKKLYHDVIKFAQFDPELHFYTSFDHLANYGPKYYSYLWSRVFAHDIFSELKKAGFSPNVWDRYKKLVLAPGGSKSPEKIIAQFLMRRASVDAFLNYLAV